MVYTITKGVRVAIGAFWGWAGLACWGVVWLWERGETGRGIGMGTGKGIGKSVRRRSSQQPFSILPCNFPLNDVSKDCWLDGRPTLWDNSLCCERQEAKGDRPQNRKKVTKKHPETMNGLPPFCSPLLRHDEFYLVEEFPSLSSIFPFSCQWESIVILDFYKACPLLLGWIERGGGKPWKTNREKDHQ